MKYLINVTEEDIALGCKTENNNCPVARALQRELGSAGWGTDGDSIYNYSGFGIALQMDKVIDINAPDSVRVFVDRFDDDRSVEPFTFEIEI